MQLDGFEVERRVAPWRDDEVRVEYRIRSGSDSAWFLLHFPRAAIPGVTFIPESSFRRVVTYVPNSHLCDLEARLVQ